MDYILLHLEVFLHSAYSRKTKHPKQSSYSVHTHTHTHTHGQTPM